ncbi:MFS transporter [Enterovirga rhinocerotis]|uniref:Cyanate permease n=1 Tax=Enterovirga rhinocerotis TaxID=1339210 RepID=A0A4R7CAE0_9HYPH|nr:MFS transporter [Enterovirga rhinocerotis]TDR95692.1 cyanate permease [Enterovirga rhinocerotis]
MLGTLLVQATAAFLTRIIPTIAPAVGPEFGWTDTTIGYLAAATTFGSIAFLAAGGPLIRHLGPIRALQIGLGLGLVGLALLPVPATAATVAGCLLIGLGYAPSSPAGSDILQRHAPPAHRNLIFSIKQAGVPVGGVLAGLALPPLAQAYGWQSTLLASAGLVLLTVALVQPLRDRLDSERYGGRLGWRSFLSRENLQRPLRALGDAPGTLPLSLAGACLAYGQGCWFAFLVTFAVVELGYSLVAAGLLFGIMQATGVAGRILLGWLSDRLGSGILTLRLVAAAGVATALAAGLSSKAWPLSAVAILSGIAGITVSSWNGVQIAEIARRAKPGQISETAAGATMLIFIGLFLGPMTFAAILGATGRFDLSFYSVALMSVLPILILTPLSHKPLKT